MTINILSPTNGQVFLSQSNLVIESQATPLTGTVSLVELFAQNLASTNATPILLGRVTNSIPGLIAVQHNWTNAPPGVYNLFATGGNPVGNSCTSSPVTITLDRPMDCLWARLAGYATREFGYGYYIYATDVATDTNDNIFICGYFHHDIFLGNTYYTNASGYDFGYLAKYDPRGNLLWSSTHRNNKPYAGIQGGAGLASLATTQKGYVVAAGCAYLTLSLPSNSIPYALVTDKPEAYISVSTPEGKTLWARRFGGSANRTTLQCKVDAQDNPIIAYTSVGNYSVEGVLSNAAPNSQGIMLIKYDLSGNRLWSQRLGTNATLQAMGCDKQGNIVISGRFSGSIDLGITNITTTAEKAFLAKLSPGGNALWAKCFDYYLYQNMLSLDVANNIYACASIYETTVIGTNVFNPNGYDYGLVKYDPSGEIVYSVLGGGDGSDSVRNMQCTSDGGMLVLIDWNFGVGKYRHYVVKHSANGIATWTNTIDNTLADVNCLTVNRQGHAFVAGRYTASTTIAGSYFPVTSLRPEQIILAKMADTLTPFVENLPKDVILNQGSNTTLNVTAGGAEPFTYQWRHNGVDIPTATGPSLTLRNTQASEAGFYSVGITNGYGSIESSNIQVNVRPFGTPIVWINGMHEAGGSFNIGSSAEISMKTDLAEGTILYSLDGSDPMAGTSYAGPFTVTNPVTIRALAFSPGVPEYLEADPIYVSIYPPRKLLLGTLGGGTTDVFPQTNAFLNGTEAMITGTTNNGWRFLRWAGTFESSNNPAMVTMDRDQNIQAVFGTKVTAANATIEPIQEYYEYGATVRLSAKIPTNQYLVRWTGAAAAFSNSPIRLVITNKNPFVSITTSLFPTNSGTTYRLLNLKVTGNGEVRQIPFLPYYTNGASVALTAIPDAGHYFLQWLEDAVGDNPETSILLDRYKTVTAVFTNQPALPVFAQEPANLTVNASSNITLSGQATGRPAPWYYWLFNGGLLAGQTNATLAIPAADLSQAGAYQLVATNDAGAITSRIAMVTVNVPDNPPIFWFSSASYQASEGGSNAVVTVYKSASSTAASVNYATANGTAHAVGAGQAGDYQAVSGSLAFTNGEAARTLLVPIVNDLLFQGNRSFNILLSAPTGNGMLTNPSTATVTILDDDAPSSTNVFTEVVFPGMGAPANAAITVTLEPAAAGGQWRLAWETAWRNSGATASGLIPGNYEIEYRPVPGFWAPANSTNAVTAGSPTMITNVYIEALIPRFGVLTVQLFPASVAAEPNLALRGQWRLQGEPVWRDSGATISNLVAGWHIVEFKSVTDKVAPVARAVEVAADQANVLDATYLAAAYLPGSGPAALSSYSAISEGLNHGYPYAFSGQLLSESGYGSGFVVKRRVVLTAAHMVFNDANLTWVSRVHWFFQKHRGEYEPFPQHPRGWYVYGGYAAQRTNDNSPGVSSPAAQNLDVAALYFDEDAGRGGYGGWLSSDAESHEWLGSPSLKMLIGYPVETVSEADRGKIHRTTPENVSFTRVANYRVYTTQSIKSYPGGSGGPLCVQFTNGWYYPTAVYLGGSGQMVVRAIDNGVVDLIGRADTSANGGGNNSGGGVVLLQPGTGGGLFEPGYLQVVLGPDSALNAGAAWRLLGHPSPDFYTNNTASYGLLGGAYTLQFRSIAGYATPTNRSIQITPKQTALIYVNYPANLGLALPVRSSNGLMSFGLTGQPGSVYVLEASTNLGQTNWEVLATNTMGTNGAWSFFDTSSTNLPNRFYRAREK